MKREVVEECRQLQKAVATLHRQYDDDMYNNILIERHFTVTDTTTQIADFCTLFYREARENNYGLKGCIRELFNEVKELAAIVNGD